VRCYVLACKENQADKEDLFTAKLKSYRDEFSSVLAQAQGATPEVEGNPVAVFSIPLERA